VAARESRSRPKERKIDADPELHKRVAGDLMKGWSPEEIAGRGRYEASRGETDMSVSHEAIYTWIYAQPKGELSRVPELSSGPAASRGNPAAGRRTRARRSSG
jgi:transposase, IS30 family